MSRLETSESTVPVSRFPLLDCYVVTRGRAIYIANVEFNTVFDTTTRHIDVCAAEPLPTAPNGALRVDAETFRPPPETSPHNLSCSATQRVVGVYTRSPVLISKLADIKQGICLCHILVARLWTFGVTWCQGGCLGMGCDSPAPKVLQALLEQFSPLLSDS